MTTHHITGTHAEVMAEVDRITAQAVADGYGYNFRPILVSPAGWHVTVTVHDAPQAEDSPHE